MPRVISCFEYIEGQVSESTFVNILPQLFNIAHVVFDFFLGYWCKSINHRKLLIVLPSDLLVSQFIVFLSYLF